MHTLFFEDISQYNVFRLAAWIKKCRSAIRLSDNPIYQGDYFSYVSAVEEFCGLWGEHYSRYRSVYTDTIYSDALLYLSLQEPEVYVIAGGDHIDISAKVRADLQDDTCYCNLIQQVASKEKQRIREYATQLRRIARSADGRHKLHEFMQSIKFRTIQYEHTVLQSDGIDYSGMPIADVLPLLKRRSLKTWAREYAGDTNTTFNDFIMTELKAAHIGKNAYYAYVSPKKKISTTQKSFFACLSFFLNMDIDTAESFYNQEGYTVMNSLRNDDKILTTCLEMGFPLDYANALLVADGYPALDNTRKPR